MLRVDRPSIDVGADSMASHFLSLDQSIMVWGAYAFVVRWVDEQGPVAAVRGAVVNDRGSGDLAAHQASFAQRLLGELLHTQPLPAAPNG